MTATSAKFEKSTYSQNRAIYFSLGLDVRGANLSLSETAEIIQTMQTDPQFAYDFLIQKNGVIVKDEKTLARSIAKVQKHGRLFSEKKKEKVVKIKKEKVVKTKITKKGENSISMNEILNHIIRNIPEYTAAITLQNICDSFNKETKRNVQLSRMSSVLAGLTVKGLITRISKGIYKPSENLIEQSLNKISSEPALVQRQEPQIGRTYVIGHERKLFEEFVRKNNKTGELIFTLDELHRAYPDADPKKLSKAVQNMKFNSTNLVGTGVLGQYKITAPVAVTVAPAIEPSVAITPSPAPSLAPTVPSEDEDLIVEAAKLVKALGIEKSKALLERVNRILQIT